MTGVDVQSVHPIGKIAALNIVKSLGLSGDKAVSTVEHAISDEIKAMSSHFTLAVADLRDSYDFEVKKIKATWTYISDNPWKVIGVVVGSFLTGVFAGAALMYA